MTEFAFDVRLCAAIRVNADTEERAREILAEVFDAADLSVTSGGLLPATFEASLADRPRLFERDGDAV